MSEETQVPLEDSEPVGDATTGADTSAAGAKSAAEESWREVGKQFEALGSSLAQAFRSAWDNEDNQRRLSEVRNGLESMVRDVGKAIDDTAHSEQGQRIRQDAERAAEKLRNAGEQTVQEVRPQLINALEQVNVELQKLITRLESRTPPPPPPSDTDPGSSDPDVQI